jgi:hypothetical protein
MTEMISDNPAARRLPSRHQFALARLVASLMQRFVAPPKMNVDHLLLAVDREQDAVENYTVSVWFWLSAACYLAAVLPLHPVLAIVIAIPLAAFVVQIPLYLGATRMILMFLFFCVSAYFATAAGPLHYVAWFSLAVFVTNATAWIIGRVCGI